MMPYGYLVAALLVLAALAGAGWKGYQFGSAAVQTRWDRANAEAVAAADAERKAQEAKARRAAATYQAKIATAEITNRQIADALQRELARKPLPPECVIPDSVRDIWNAANSGREAAPAGSLLSAGGAAAPAR